MTDIIITLLKVVSLIDTHVILCTSWHRDKEERERKR